VQRAADHFTSTPQREKARACELAGRACGLEQSDPLSLTILSGAYTLVHDLETADTLVEKALLLEPSSAWAWARSGWLRCYRGEPAEATERFQIALEFAPGDLMRYLNLIGLGSAQFREARYPEAVRWWRRALVEQPGAVWLHRFFAPALALCGRTSEAQRSFGALFAKFPELTIADVKTGLPVPTDYLDRVAEGLESLGMPLG